MHIPTLLRQIKSVIAMNRGSTLTRSDYKDSGSLPHEVLIRCRVEGLPYPHDHPITIMGYLPNPPPVTPDDYRNYQGIERARKEEMNNQQAALLPVFDIMETSSIHGMDKVRNSATKTPRQKYLDIVDILTNLYEPLAPLEISRLKATADSLPNASTGEQAESLLATLNGINSTIDAIDHRQRFSNGDLVNKIFGRIQHMNFKDALKWYRAKLERGRRIHLDDFMAEIRACFPILNGGSDHSHFDLSNPSNPYSSFYLTGTQEMYRSKVNIAQSSTAYLSTSILEQDRRLRRTPSPDSIHRRLQKLEENAKRFSEDIPRNSRSRQNSRSRSRERFQKEANEKYQAEKNQTQDKKICYTFERTGVCSRGDSCRFSHGTQK